jgi:leucyl/phenylalanyl-tRNA--protein transferase
MSNAFERAAGDALYWVRAQRLGADFPPPTDALDEPNGLLAIGGDLGVPRLLAAYARGIFPWYSDGQPILWWSPDPRTVLAPTAVHIARRFARRLRNSGYTVSFDRDFEQVLAACAAPRAGRESTWITGAMARAYTALHRAGHAHSVECWHGERLVGGVYGVALGRMFFGESMFSAATDGSKTALVALCRWLAEWDYALIDCQMPTAHLARLGAQSISRAEFLRTLATSIARPPTSNAWREASSTA